MLPIQYHIKRSSRRKTISLQVKNGELRVLAPEYVAQSYIVDLVRQKDKWIRAKIAQQNFNMANRPVALLTDNSELLYLGTPYLVRLYSGDTDKSTIKLDSAKHTLSVTQAYDAHEDDANPELNLASKTALADWYLKAANSYLPCRLAFWGEEMSLDYSGLKIRHYKSRWGSCNSKRFITLNTMLMMAPKWVIDYVIIHELSHLVHLNHSTKFWQLVASYCPKYRQAREWFKQEHCNLRVFD